MAHAIRLRRAWECRPQEARTATGSPGPATGVPASNRADVPGDWRRVLGQHYCGGVEYSRNFNCPTNLEPAERVWIVCAGVSAAARFVLNGQVLFQTHAAASQCECDITSRLLSLNRLTIELPAGDAQAAGEITGEVRLEIRPA